MDLHKKEISLGSRYRLEICSQEDFWQNNVRSWMDKIFADEGLVLYPHMLMSEQEKEKLRELNASASDPYAYYSVLKFENSLAGWMWGYQDSKESFYMVNSAILPEHQRKGLYSALLEEAMKTLQAKGFQRLWSRHTATNNSILIPKLKRGFIITGMELSDVFGSLIYLTYFTNQTRRHAMDFRAGQKKPNAQLKSILDL